MNATSEQFLQSITRNADVETFCSSNHIRRLSVFGSILRDDFGPGSDLDLLVEFEPGHTPGLSFFAMERELSRMLHRKVNLNTPDFLGKEFRQAVVSEARLLFEN